MVKQEKDKQEMKGSCQKLKASFFYLMITTFYKI